MKSLSLAKIRTDGGTQMRVAINNETLLDYRNKWKAGVEFDPIDVFYDGATHWLADGFHRFYGAREAKRKDIPATIHNGTVRDAILFACGANNSHGLHRSNADKRRSVTTLLGDEEWSSWSDRVIAEKCGVNNSTVSAIRGELLDSNSSVPTKTTGKDGKKRPAKMPKSVAKKPESNGKAQSDSEPPRNTRDITPLDKLKEFWAMANATQKSLFRDWIEQHH